MGRGRIIPRWAGVGRRFRIQTNVQVVVVVEDERATGRMKMALYSKKINTGSKVTQERKADKKQIRVAVAK